MTTNFQIRKEDFFEKFPVIGEKSEIYLFRDEDITKEYISWLNDKEITQFSNQRFLKHNYESCQQYFGTMKQINALFFGIRALNTNQMIGTLSIHFNEHHGTADMGILIGNREIWGKGFGSDAWRAALATVLKHPNVRKITAGTLRSNIGMLKIINNSDMVPDGVRYAQELVNGIPTDILYYARFK